MSSHADPYVPPVGLDFWLDLVRTRTAALLHRLADTPGTMATPNGARDEQIS